jgi:hypothetical protein
MHSLHQGIGVRPGDEDSAKDVPGKDAELRGIRRCEPANRPDSCASGTDVTGIGQG